MKFSLAATTFDSHGSFSIGKVMVLPVAVPHDAREPTQFVFGCDGIKIGVLSDLGHVTPHVVSAYRDCDLLMMESNHDVDMLMAGRYPPSLKRRVGGVHGHLSNQQAAELLEAVGHANLRVVIGHVSEQNNALPLIEEALGGYRPKLRSLEIASQSDGVSWQTLDESARTASLPG